MNELVAVSACLAGMPCRYNGQALKVDQDLMAFLSDVPHVFLCPELLAGLGVPRIPCEITGGDGADVLAGAASIVNAEGEDVTEAMIEGAAVATEICKKLGVTKAFLKANSPSCGSGQIYDGTFSGSLVSGDGVFACMLKREGTEVISL